MKKILFVLLACLATGCLQLQIPIASAVTNITVIKTQNGEASMSGAKLQDIAKGASQKAGDVSIPPI